MEVQVSGMRSNSNPVSDDVDRQVLDTTTKCVADVVKAGENTIII